MKLSIIISNRNDIAMLAVTVRSCIEELITMAGDYEIVICDNSDRKIYESVKLSIPQKYQDEGIVKIVRQNFPCLFTARETAAREAIGNYILCLDGHMLCGRGMLTDMVNFMDRHSDDHDLGFGHAPISWAHQHESVAKHDRDMSLHELGDWNLQYNIERTITWKGMPWICRREWFLDRETGLNGYGALAQHRVSWGGGDILIGIKPWLLGFKNWAIPTRPGIHIGPFPLPSPREANKEIKDKDIARRLDMSRYRVYKESGSTPHTLGYLLACYVLGGESMMHRNKKVISDKFHRYFRLRDWWYKVIEMGQDERNLILRRQIMSFDDLLKEKPWENGY